ERREVAGSPCYSGGAPVEEAPRMPCPRCQHENRPQARFCDECAGPLKGASPVTRSPADDLRTEVETLRQALTAAPEPETATGSILRAIATSPTDSGPVFESILESALRLCHASIGAVTLSDGHSLSVAAVKGRAEWVEAVRLYFPCPLDSPGLATRAVRE